MAPGIVYLPEMALTLVRRVTARLPRNHYLFRTDTKWTKTEIREYLTKVYGVQVARIATSISQGALHDVALRRRGAAQLLIVVWQHTWVSLRSLPAGKVRRVTGKRSLYKLTDYKKVYVRLQDSNGPVAQTTEAALR